MNLPRLRRRRTRVVMVHSVDRFPAGETFALEPELAGKWIAAGYCRYAGGVRPSELEGRAFDAELELSQQVDV